jgi:hypothetical protein
LLQRLQERRDLRLTVRIGGGHVHEHTYAPHPLGLLRTRRKRPRGDRSNHHLDEIAPSHCVAVPLQCWLATRPIKSGN